MTRELAQTFDRGLALLELLAATPAGVTITEAAHNLGVGRAIIYRLVATLESHGLARRDESTNRIRIGFGVLSLAQSVQPLLRDAAIPALRRLAEDLRATAHLTVVDGGEALALVVVEPTTTAFHVAYRTGSRHPLDRGAAGRAILAARDHQPRFVMSTGELQAGAHGVAVALSADAGIEGSVGVIALDAFDADVVGPRLVAAAAEVSEALRG